MPTVSATRHVPVPGGTLAVETYGGATTPVLAVHGVSSNARLWNWLHAQAPEIALLAPDLRGRGGSWEVPGPSSLARHADDAVAVLDDAGLDRVVVCGMSMGGFVAVTLALRHPDRVRGLLLVDGGFPLDSEGLTPESVRAAFAPQAARRDHVFADVDAYRDFFLTTPNVLDADDPLLTDYLRHDLDDDGRVRLAGDLVLDDAVETLLHPPRWEDLAVPVRFLAAQWSAGAGSAPGYPDPVIARFRAGLPSLVHAERVADVDHGASIMTARGARAVARVLREAVAG